MCPIIRTLWSHYNEHQSVASSPMLAAYFHATAQQVLKLACSFRNVVKLRSRRSLFSHGVAALPQRVISCGGRSRDLVGVDSVLIPSNVQRIREHVERGNRYRTFRRS